MSEAPFTEEMLQVLYHAVSAPDGVAVSELRAFVGEFTNRPIAKVDLQAYREGRKPWKKLRDEIVPVERVLSAISGRRARSLSTRRSATGCLSDRR